MDLERTDKVATVTGSARGIGADVTDRDSVERLVAAKAGILGLSKSQANEQGRYGITVNAVVPGFIETDAVRSLAHFEKIRDKAVAATLRRTGQPSDLAGAVAYLFSYDADYISGEALVTGGRFR